MRETRSVKFYCLLGLVLLVVSTLPVFGAGGKETGEQEMAATEGPQYGGTLTLFVWGGDPPTADRGVGPWQTVQYTSPILEYLVEGDFAKYGPRGTGKQSSFVGDVHPEEFLRGAIAESWEVTADMLVLKIRPGIMWASYENENVMKPREVTSEDVAYSLNRSIDSVTLGGGNERTENGGFISEIYASDESTVVVNTSVFSAGVLDLLGRNSTSALVPREYVDAGASDWENLVGTGPFMFEEFVDGSFMSYVRNPNYWDTATIDGKEYEIPFIDELVMPIIPDQASQIAALRTGTLDRHATVTSTFQETLAKTSPELIKTPWFQPVSMFVALNLDNPIFSDVKVRQALMLSMDQDAMVDAVMNVGSVYGYPIDYRTGDAFTPIDEMPGELKDLFQHDTALAKSLLVEAGYPDGFTVDMICNPQSTGGMHPPAAEMVASYWSEIGVKVNVRVLEPTAEVALRNAREGYDTILQVALVIDPKRSLKENFLPDRIENVANYDNPEYTELYEKAMKTVDPAERTAMFKRLNIMALEDLPYIPVGSPGRLDYWWPWVRNYYGELLGIFRSIGPIMAPVWIDKDLKKGMGY